MNLGQVNLGRAHASLTLALILLLAASPSAQEKQITIYAQLTNYSLPVMETGGHDYVGLLELLEPLGNASSKLSGKKWKLRFNNIDSEFSAGKTGFKVGRQKFDLPAPFILVNDRGLVPVDSLYRVLPPYLGMPMEFHQNSRRLFLGVIPTQFQAELKKGNPPRLVLNFSAPVSPSIATEPGKLTMVFQRDPLIASGNESLSFGDKTITGAAYTESNGTAQLTITSSAPLLATFSNGGATVTLTPPVQAAQATPPAAPAMPPVATPSAPAVQKPVVPKPAGPSPGRFVVVIDASHGGDERGAALSDTLAEKDVTLAIARRLHHELEARGISAVMARDSDVVVGMDQRAQVANTARASVFVSIHAGTVGNGLRVYTAMLSPGDRKPFLPWQTAQSSYLDASRAVAADILIEAGKHQVLATEQPAVVRPLNSVAGAAVAVEVMPPETEVEGLTLSAYQQLVADIIASAVVASRTPAPGATP